MVALDFKNPALDAVFRRAREHSGNRIIGQNSRCCGCCARSNAAGVGLLADLALKLDQPGELIDAFGLKMHVTFLHALLHARTGVPIVPVTNVPHPDGTCTVTAHAPLVFPAGTGPAHDHAGVLGFLRAVHPRPARTLAVELQALPLPSPGRSRRRITRSTRTGRTVLRKSSPAANRLGSKDRLAR